MQRAGAGFLRTGHQCWRFRSSSPCLPFSPGLMAVRRVMRGFALHDVLIYSPRSHLWAPWRRGSRRARSGALRASGSYAVRDCCVSTVEGPVRLSRAGLVLALLLSPPVPLVLEELGCVRRVRQERASGADLPGGGVFFSSALAHSASLGPRRASTPARRGPIRYVRMRIWQAGAPWLSCASSVFAPHCSPALEARAWARADGGPCLEGGLVRAAYGRRNSLPPPFAQPACPVSGAARLGISTRTSSSSLLFISLLQPTLRLRLPLCRLKTRLRLGLEHELGKLPALPIFFYVVLALVCISLIIYAAHRIRPSTRLSRLNDVLAGATEILARAKSECLRDLLDLADKEARLLQVKLSASKIETSLLEARNASWETYLHKTRAISHSLDRCEHQVRELQTSTLASDSVSTS
ncbi:hypothetical protein FB451DRAFT_1558085 [Mycena latifolia]|nr:hypothetical protein FB451DRAFT_1558085 [Mycena latifolia]